MSFESFVCWKPNDVDRIAPIDVTSIEHDVDGEASVFLATHQSLHLIRLPDAASADGEVISEHALLEEFSKPVGNDPQITVITGSVGTGKSHMVKWLHAGNADRNDWHQVYIEKRNTNLRRVIDTILAGLSGPRVSELREQLQVAMSALRDLTEAKNRVLLELSQHVLFPAGGSSATSDFELEVRKQLPHILNDPVLSRHLLREHGAIHRITRLGLEGLQQDDEDEHDMFFREEDLPLSPEDLLDASKPAQIAIRRLSSNERLRSTAVEVLNRELGAAKAAVFLGSGVDLTSVFDEVRLELAKRDLELVLYIEDLVFLHGIDRELAQVFTEGRGKTGDRCGIRVAIAVTEGYLSSGFDTLTSRAKHYSLNLRLGDDVSWDQARAFVGRYLNAIRVGTTRLRESRTSGPAEEWVPNACDACDFREECHSAFGADANNYGFYPLNDLAVDRLVTLADAATTKEGRFDPRKVLRHVVRDPLQIAATELPEGGFPSSSFAGSLDHTRKSVSVEVRHSLEATPEGERRITLLGFWAPEPVTQVVNLDPAVHIAFQLPEYQGADREERGHEPAGHQRKPRTRETRSVDWPEIEAWSNEEQVLPSGTARTVRYFIFDAVLEQVRSGPAGLRVKGASRKFDVGPVRFEENSIRIEAAQGGGAELERPFEIKIERSAPMAVLLKAILTTDREQQWLDDQQYTDFVGHIERWTSELTAIATSRSVDLEPAIRLLALTSQPSVADAKSAGERFELMLQARPDPAPRGAAWQAWAKQKAQTRRKTLEVVDRNLTSTKGAGAPSFLDSAVILDRLDKAGVVRQLGDTRTGTQQFIELQRQTSDLQVKTAESAWKQIDRVLGPLVGFIASGQSWKKVRDSVEAAMDLANDAGLLPVATAKADLAELADTVPADAMAVVATLLRKAESSKRELWDLVPDPLPTLEALLAYCTNVSAVFGVLEARLDEELGTHGDNVGPGTAAVSIRNLADALTSVVAEGES